MKQCLFSFVFLFSLLILSCETESKKSGANTAFVKKHGHENFQKFKGFFISLRSYDWDGDPIVLIFKNPIDTGYCRFPYRVIVNHKSHEVKSADRNWLDSNSACAIDTSLMIQQALEFVQYNITHIDIDEKNNINIKTQFFEGLPNLIHFSDMKYKTEKYKEWEHISGNWYELPR